MVSRQISKIWPRFIICRHCNASFFVCQNCYRGQRYCSVSCRITRTEGLRRLARRRYAQTRKAKLLACKRSFRYRIKLLRQPPNNFVTDASIAGPQPNVIPARNTSLFGNGRCQSCERMFSESEKLQSTRMGLLTVLSSRWTRPPR